MFGDWRVQSIIKIVANNWQMNQCSSFSAADYSFSYYRSLTANLERFSYWLCVLVLFSFDDTVWLLHSVHPSGFNTGVFCSFDLTYSGTLIIIIIIIRELLLGTHIILNVFFFLLACWRIHFGSVSTPAFIPSLLLDEGHCLYLQNDFPLFSFIPAFLPSSTPGHESENLTPRRRGRRTVQREKGDKMRKKGAEMKPVGEMSWSISQRNLRRCGLALLPWCARHCLKNGNWINQSPDGAGVLAVLYSILIVSYSMAAISYCSQHRHP